MRVQPKRFDARKYDLVIFDWDGTLMDSIGKIIVCIENMARVLTLPIPTESDIRDIIGLSMTEALRVLFPQGLNPCAASVYSLRPHPKNAFSQGEEDEYLQMRAEFKAQYLHLDTTPTPLFAQAPVLIDDLHNQGYQLAVATGKARAGLERVFEQTGLGRYFVASRCADEVHSKPHPEMISSLLSELNVAPNRALMVGDSLLDLTMAANAGIDSVGVTYGAHSAEKLLRAKPIALIDSPAQLLQYL
ncbi:HAD-IA family hydrolase [Shewanella sp. CG12_big_fil_rev_8_21_14_0_65_47_15]|uniref:HAD-IA family hydrolase n=1 Tax=Shewanella sp. CG12_big_fil_rev_8_21_14_0_65_47_15 TaxID=1975537 RepID=UPI000CBF0236|nr:HAD-IA family hydrolase [Shewanella sp. CG12_big_fil_rev_8_21_14_0_65_47_15]PIW61154.1 MAG: HAD family hydrolase [Shewanella sp. CG12_big_fil_rev_8_21_14_0_65_47_15]